VGETVDGVKEVFLVHSSGCLLAYRVPNPATEVDFDLVVGMLTALQSFVHDAFGGGKSDLRGVEFGDKNVLLELRDNFYMAAVSSGRPSNSLRNRLKGLMDKLAERYGRQAKDWDGDMVHWEGAGDMLDSLFKSETPERGRGLCPLCGTVPADPDKPCSVCGFIDGQNPT